MLPKVSIIIPTYNRAALLPEAVESALNQTYPNIEIIVVDDGSTDHTERVLAPYRKSIRYIKRENGGCSAAKNTGLANATGDFITNLDDDDRIHPTKIARQVEMFQKRPALGICGTWVNIIDEQGRVTRRYTPPPISPETQVLSLLRKCVLIQSSVLIRQECHQRLGGYKPTNAQDYDFWLRVSLDYEIGVVDEFLTDYRCHDAQITRLDNRPNVAEDVGQIVRQFIRHVPLERIIPDLRSYPEANSIVGIALCEQGVFDDAKTFFARALPNPAAHLGRGIIALHQKDFTEARTCFENVRTSSAPFASRGEDALHLTNRVQAIAQKTGVYHNQSPEVVQLRTELSCLRTSILRHLLHLARGSDAKPLRLENGRMEEIR